MLLTGVYNNTENKAAANNDRVPTAGAQALLQRAERKRGLDAVPTYEQAAVSFHLHILNFGFDAQCFTR